MIYKYVDFSKFQEFIEIYNLLGEKVLTSKKFTLLKEIDISILPKGLYILKLRQTTRKFLRN